MGVADVDRKSHAATPSLITDPLEIAKREAENGVRQYDEAVRMILSWLDNPERQFRLRPSSIQRLQRIALDGLDMYAGNWRPGTVAISGSDHKPMDAFIVAEQVEELCDYVNDNWDTKTAIHLAAYVLWRLNWIHPFTDGNGRTSRIVSYLVLSVKLNSKLPGTRTIPDQIASNKKPYYSTLEMADAAWQDGERVDVSGVEKLIAETLASQLLTVIEDATGEKRG